MTVPSDINDAAVSRSAEIATTSLRPGGCPESSFPQFVTVPSAFKARQVPAQLAEMAITLERPAGTFVAKPADPQAATVPSFLKAKLYPFPAATATTLDKPAGELVTLGGVAYPSTFGPRRNNRAIISQSQIVVAAVSDGHHIGCGGRHRQVGNPKRPIRNFRPDND